MFDFKTSSGLSSSLGIGKSKGLILSVEAREILKKEPPTASDRNLYSFSGSITMTSTPVIRERKISIFTKKLLPEPAVPKKTSL